MSTSEFQLSRRSVNNLLGVHPNLVDVCYVVIKFADFTVLEGLRTRDRQEQLFTEGRTKTLQSKHLKQADGYSHAVDLIACPIDWEDRIRNTLFAGFVKGVAAGIGVNLRIGADWDGDFSTKDQRFHDLVHFELA